MPLFLIVILGSMLLGDIAFWLWADRQAPPHAAPEGLAAAARRSWVGVLLGYLLWFLDRCRRRRGRRTRGCRSRCSRAMYIWHLLILPATLLYIISTSDRRPRAAGSAHRVASARTATIEDAADLGLRDLAAAAGDLAPPRRSLAAAAVAAPPLLTGGGVGAGDAADPPVPHPPHRRSRSPRCRRSWTA